MRQFARLPRPGLRRRGGGHLSGRQPRPVAALGQERSQSAAAAGAGSSAPDPTPPSSASTSTASTSAPAAASRRAGQQSVALADGPPAFTPSPTSFGDAVAVFTSHPTPRLVCALLAAGAAGRSLVGGPAGPLDAVAVAAGAAGWVLAEPAIHWLLHLGDWRGSRIHADHHAAPYHHVSIDAPVLVAAWISAVGALAGLAVSLGGAPSGPALSGVLGYCAAGLAYEAVHFGSHCAYPPVTAWGRALKAHHARHHLRSEAHWLAFQAPFLDAWVGRAPAGEVAPGPMAVAARAAARKAAARKEDV